jgi:hypothetical protein
LQYAPHSGLTVCGSMLTYKPIRLLLEEVSWRVMSKFGDLF